MRFVKPEVFLIAKSKLDDTQIAAWLTSLGCDNETVYKYSGQSAVADYSVPDGERIVELAGRRCYLSFAPKMNPNVSKIRADIAEYCKNILKSGHGCYDIETDVLTSVGWVNWSEATANHKFATRRRDGIIEYHFPKALIKQQYSGRMYRVDSPGVDLLVTPNHNMLACPTSTIAGREKTDFNLFRADYLNSISYACIKTGEWTADSENAILDTALFRLLGFAIGDGNMQPNSSKVKFHLRRERKIFWLIDVVSRLGLEVAGDDDHYVVDVRTHKAMFQDMYNADREKRIPQYLLTASSRTQLNGLFEGLMQSDGHEGRTGDSFDTTSQELAGQFQQLCLHVGLAANVCYTYGPERRTSSFGEKPLTRLSVLRRNLKPEINKYNGTGSISYWTENWSGDVFCAEVPNNTLYVRRNGIPVWCGNSVLEHVSFTFAIENVSRVFSGEMNRHRAGTAISEGSMRYIRYTDIPIVETPLLTLTEDDKKDMDYLSYENASSADNELHFTSTAAKKAKTRAVFQKITHQIEDAYGQLQAIWSDELKPESKFSDKKHVTSMMRRIIPMGVATGGVWTANIRALRHICTMRCSEAAEEEIALVAGKILEIMMREEPTLFGDFHLNDRGYWEPVYAKV